jgi:hypothetical protein
MRKYHYNMEKVPPVLRIESITQKKNMPPKIIYLQSCHQVNHHLIVSSSGPAHTLTIRSIRPTVLSDLQFPPTYPLLHFYPFVSSRAVLLTSPGDVAYAPGLHHLPSRTSASRRHIALRTRDVSTAVVTAEVCCRADTRAAGNWRRETAAVAGIAAEAADKKMGVVKKSARIVAVEEAEAAEAVDTGCEGSSEGGLCTAERWCRAWRASDLVGAVQAEAEGRAGSSLSGPAEEADWASECGRDQAYLLSACSWTGGQTTFGGRVTATAGCFGGRSRQCAQQGA